MDFTYQSPGWSAEGQEPNELKSTGWQPNQKPPAGIFNWFWTRVSNCITELQTKLANHQHPVGDVAGVLPIEKGGTGAASIIDALTGFRAFGDRMTGLKNVDLDDVVTPGSYYVTANNASTITHGAFPGAYHLHVLSSFDGTYCRILQVAVRTSANIIKARSFGVGDTIESADFEQLAFIGSNVASATMASALANARTIRVDLGSTDAVSFNGTANVTPGVAGTLPIARGGTGGASAAAARTALGVPATNHTHTANNITSGTLPVTRGGTGSSTAEAARAALGVEPEITSSELTVSSCVVASGVGTLDTSDIGAIKRQGKRIAGYLNFSGFISSASGQTRLARFNSAYRPKVNTGINGRIKKTNGTLDSIQGVIYPEGYLDVFAPAINTEYNGATVYFDFFCG